MQAAHRIIVLLLIWCRWAYDHTKACLVLDSDTNTLLKKNKRHSPEDAHNLEVR